MHPACPTLTHQPIDEQVAFTSVEHLLNLLNYLGIYKSKSDFDALLDYVVV